MSGFVRGKSDIMEFQTGRQNGFVRRMHMRQLMDFVEFLHPRFSMDSELVQLIPGEIPHFQELLTPSFVKSQNSLKPLYNY